MDFFFCIKNFLIIINKMFLCLLLNFNVKFNFRYVFLRIDLIDTYMFKIRKMSCNCQLLESKLKKKILHVNVVSFLHVDIKKADWILWKTNKCFCCSILDLNHHLLVHVLSIHVYYILHVPCLFLWYGVFKKYVWICFSIHIVIKDTMYPIS